MAEHGSGENISINSGTEKSNQTLEQKVRDSDPRDYIRISTFQKRAREIDNNPAHPWETLPREGFTWVSNDESEVMLALISNGIDKPKGLLLAVKTLDNDSVTAYIANLEPSVMYLVEETTSFVARRFPTNEKKLFIKKMIADNPELVKLAPDQAAKRLAMMAIELLPNDPRAIALENEIEFPEANYGKPKISEEQNADLQSYFKLLSTKMPGTEFQIEIDKYLSDIPYTDEAYGRNFNYIFLEGLRWLQRSRPDMFLNNKYNFSYRAEKSATFPIKDLLKRKIDTVEQLREVLTEIPVKQEPDTTYLEYGQPVVEFVDIEKIVGGSGIIDWAIISTSEGRGIENVKKIVDGFTNGTIDVSGNNEPIGVKEIEGEYYISRDGRHRVGAMKALGIPFAPMEVIHMKEYD